MSKHEALAEQVAKIAYAHKDGTLYLGPEHWKRFLKIADFVLARVIERAVIMYSNPGDVVLSPFMGIGSEGYVALKERRKFIGIELSGEKYFPSACLHLDAAERNAPMLFDALECA